MTMPTWYDSIHDVPESERPAAREAYRLAARATVAMRLYPAGLHAASQAIEAHKRKTGWRYLPSGKYRHSISTGTTP